MRYLINQINNSAELILTVCRESGLKDRPMSTGEQTQQKNSDILGYFTTLPMCPHRARKGSIFPYGTHTEPIWVPSNATKIMAGHHT